VLQIVQLILLQMLMDTIILKYYFIQINQTIENKEVAGIILCNADDTTINNVTFKGYINNRGTGLIATVNTNNITVTNSSFSSYRHGIFTQYNSISNSLFNNLSFLDMNYGGVIEIDDGGTNNQFINLNISALTSQGAAMDLTMDDSNFTNITIECDGGKTDDPFNLYGDNNIITNLNINSRTYSASLIITGDNNILRNSTIQAGAVDGDNSLNLYGDNNSVYGNNITSTSYRALTLGSGSEDNSIYNNIFNGKNTPLLLSSTLVNDWNTSKIVGTNIYNSSYGYIWGNYWTNSSGTGFSDTCTNSNGFCTQALNLSNMQPCTVGVDCGNNVDYHAISKNYTEIHEYNRTISLSTAMTTNIVKISASNREQSISTIISNNLKRYLNLNRELTITQTFTIQDISRIDWSRTLSSSFTTAPELNNFLAFLKVQTQGVTSIFDINRLFIGSRSIDNSFSLSSILNRLSGRSYSLDNSFTLNSIISRLISTDRNPITEITSVFSVDRLIETNRNIETSNTLSFDINSYIRNK